MCAAEASEARTRGASFVVRPVTYTSSTATSGESRSQNWKPAASTRQAASAMRTRRRMRGGRRRSVRTRSARRWARRSARRGRRGGACRARPRTASALPAGRARDHLAAAHAVAPERRGVDLAEELDLGLELHAEALAHAAAALGHQRDHVGRGGLAHVLHEVRVLLREARAADVSPRQPASSSRTPALRPSARGSSGFLKVEPKVLMPEGWAALREARISASVAFTDSGSAGLSANEARATISPSPGSSGGS